MDQKTAKLKVELRRAGLSDQAVDAAWPAWWSDAAADSPSAQAELRFTLARRLGLSPKPLLGERVEFVWCENARFKRFDGASDLAKGVLTSFGVAVAQHLLRATIPSAIPTEIDASKIRDAIVLGSNQVDLQGLLALCWGIGVPVIHLRIFPLPAKSMQAMVVRSQGRFAILLGKDARYPAPVAFTLAHEIAHVILGHLGSDEVLVDVEDEPGEDVSDNEETLADRFALEVLTGSPEPEFKFNGEHFNAAQLADAALRTGPSYGIEPGTLALCLAYRTKAWPVAMAALNLIYNSKIPVWREVNKIAADQLAWAQISDDTADYLRVVMGLAND